MSPFLISAVAESGAQNEMSGTGNLQLEAVNQVDKGRRAEKGVFRRNGSVYAPDLARDKTAHCIILGVKGLHEIPVRFIIIHADQLAGNRLPCYLSHLILPNLQSHLRHCPRHVCRIDQQDRIARRIDCLFACPHMVMPP